MSDYKPGTVAVVTFQTDDMLNPNTQRGIRWQRGWSVVYDEGAWELIHDRVVSDVRPLVVLDLDFIRSKPYGLPRILQDLRFAVTGGSHIADQIAEQTRPPKPAEPTGLGAVVEEAGGKVWVRVTNSGCPWQSSEPDGMAPLGCFWGDIDAVRVLSEGVQP